MTGAGQTWTNWGRSVTAHPARVATPRDTDDVVALVREAAATGTRVKAVGAGHSFTPIAATDGVQVSLARMDALVHHDATTGRVRVQAGIHLHALNPLLGSLGLALPNLGDIDAQSLAGAIATGTHGTGATRHGIAAAVVGVQLVTGEGSVLEIDESHPHLGAARVALGALGIVTEVTLQCVPAFLLRAQEESMRIEEVLARTDELVDANDHFEFLWFPHTDKALTKRNNRVPEGRPHRPPSRLSRWWNDEVLSNAVFGASTWVTARRRSWIPRASALAVSGSGARDYTDDSYRVFVSPRRVRFRESEFAVPRAAVHSVLADLRRWLDSGREHVSFPVEVRFVAADDAWLSTAHGRETCYVAVHQSVHSDHRTYFDAAQRIFTAHEGRPHWGKMHTLDATYLSQHYPRLDDFVALRDTLDPARVFDNDYLRRVLGRGKQPHPEG